MVEAIWRFNLFVCWRCVFVSSTQVTADNEAEFFITLQGAGDGELEVYGEAPYGHFPVDLLQSPDEKDTYIVRYTPQGVGDHKIHILFAGEPVKGSPFIVKVRSSVWNEIFPNVPETFHLVLLQE